MERQTVVLRYITAFILVGAIWLMMAGKLDVGELFAGLLVSLLVVFLAAPHFTFIDDIKFTPDMPIYLIRFVIVFFRALIEANIDMARRVLSPGLPIYPAVVEVHTELQSSLGKLLLANCITLTPGTLTIDVVGDTLQVHWIDARDATDIEHATKQIAERFERQLTGVVR
jgi:multicomponent Na+:H+ antiporter subunit E